MLARAVTPVVFVLGETISLGTEVSVTATEMAKSLISQNRSESATVT